MRLKAPAWQNDCGGWSSLLFGGQISAKLRQLSHGGAKTRGAESHARDFALRAVGSVASGTLAAFLLGRYHFRGVEYPLFLLAISVTVWYAGVGPGMLAVVLSSVCFNYFFTVPRFSFHVAAGDIPYYLIFILFACLLAWFSAVRRRVEQEPLDSQGGRETKDYSGGGADLLPRRAGHGRQLSAGGQRLCGETS